MNGEIIFCVIGACGYLLRSVFTKDLAKHHDYGKTL